MLMIFVSCSVTVLQSLLQLQLLAIFRLQLTDACCKIIAEFQLQLLST